MKMPRVTHGDAALVVSVVLLSAALLTPMIRARTFQRLALTAAADVEGVRAAALDAYETTGRWPASSPAGIAPEALAGAFPGDSSFVRPQYRLEWTGLQVVDYVEAEPPIGDAPEDTPPDTVPPTLQPVVDRVGAVLVHSTDPHLLSDLLGRFGSEVSYVRDSTWTLVVTDTAGVSP
jgi:hypothetical protein